MKKNTKRLLGGLTLLGSAAASHVWLTHKYNNKCKGTSIIVQSISPYQALVEYNHHVFFWQYDRIYIYDYISDAANDSVRDLLFDFETALVINVRDKWYAPTYIMAEIKLRHLLSVLEVEPVTYTGPGNLHDVLNVVNFLLDKKIIARDI